MSLIDKKLGCFMGLAVGDALGMVAEFKQPGSFTPITTMRAGGPFDLPTGYWTDDTSMAICLAESIIKKGGIDGADLLRRWRAWMKRGVNSSTGKCFDIGIGTRNALVRGYAHRDSGGNGSIMRLAPVAMRWDDLPSVVEAARLQSEITHNDSATDCAVVMATMLFDALHRRRVPEPWMDVTNDGEAWATLNAACWAVYTTRTFQGALLKAVNLGGDSDTIGAVTGQLAGALYGFEAIPAGWLKKLHDRRRLQMLALNVIGKEV